MTEECGEIVFWTLRKKFVASSDEMPEHSSQVMYYSLAIGHHVGVIDCLNVAFRCPLTEYEDWLALVEEEQARRKMLGPASRRASRSMAIRCDGGICGHNGCIVTPVGSR